MFVGAIIFADNSGTVSAQDISNDPLGAIWDAITGLRDDLTVVQKDVAAIKTSLEGADNQQASLPQPPRLSVQQVVNFEAEYPYLATLPSDLAGKAEVRYNFGTFRPSSPTDLPDHFRVNIAFKNLSDRTLSFIQFSYKGTDQDGNVIIEREGCSFNGVYRTGEIITVGCGGEWRDSYPSDLRFTLTVSKLLF